MKKKHKATKKQIKLFCKAWNEAIQGETFNLITKENYEPDKTKKQT